jgi:protease-4
MPAMKAIALISLLAGLVLAGCGQNMGYLVKPVPLDQRLEETVISRDEGLFVSDKIAVIDVGGVLLNERDLGWLSSGENPVSLFIEKLDKARADEDVKAVVLRINSPGGGVTASDIMYHRLRTFRKQRPDVEVVAIIEDVGASGAYYLACGADTILAHPSSIVGSIGVIVQTFSLAGAMRMLGVDAQAVVSGPYKDMASPLKPLEPADLEVLQHLVNQYHAEFVAVVKAGRPALSLAEVRSLSDGRVFSGSDAVDNGLVDDTGYMSDAVALARTRCGAKRVKVVMYDRPLGYRANLYSQADGGAPPQVSLLNVQLPSSLATPHPRFLYLWSGR